LSDLYEDINALVDARLKKSNAERAPVDLTDWVSQVTESLADMIVFGAPSQLQRTIMLYAIERLEHFVTENQKMLAEDAKERGGLH
jgi:hypothetical protein